MKGFVLSCVAVLALTMSAPVYAQAAKPAPAASPAKPASKPKGDAPAAPTKFRSELPVLSLATDDADDQGEALSGAIRSRLRATPGITVDDTTLNLSTLTSALGCGPRPDPLCLIKIGDQLKVEKFVWGTIKKGPERGQVTADVHLWRRGKPDTLASETYSDNLRDQNDDVLRRIAGRVLDKLLGQTVAAPVTLRVGDHVGEVIVDGTDRVAIVRGEATLELRPGKHTLEIRTERMPAETHAIEVTSTAEQVLAIKLGEQKVEPASKPISGRTVLALGLIGVGTGFGIAGTVKGLQFLSIQEENARDSQSIQAEDFCDRSKPSAADVNALDAACKTLERGQNARLLGFVFGGIAAASIGTGLVLLVTDPGDTESASKKSARARRLRVEPHVGKTSAGLDLSLKF